MKSTTSIIASLLLSLTLSACNTIKGFGKDVERGGEHVEDAAQKTQNKM